MISQIATTEFQQSLRSHRTQRPSSTTPSHPLGKPDISKTRHIASLAAMASSLEVIAHKHAGADQLRGEIAGIAAQLDAQKKQNNTAPDENSNLGHSHALGRLTISDDSYLPDKADRVLAINQLLENIDSSNQTEDGPTSASLNDALSSLQALDISLDHYQNMLSTEADNLTRPTGSTARTSQELKQTEKQIDTQQAATKTALLKQTAAVYLKGFAGISGLLPILFD